MANNISYSGTIESNGQTSLAGTKEGAASTAGKGGAGSGGSILVLGDTVSINSLDATGGETYIAGGSGRIAIYYDTSANYTSSNPSPYTQGALTPTPEVTPTETLTPTPNPGWITKDYTYSNDHPHAVVTLSSGEGYSYDGNGNMTERIEKGITWTQTYNVENRLASIENTNETWSFKYDGDGNKVKQNNPDGTVTLFLFGGLVTVEDNAMTSYYAIAGMQVAYKNADGIRYMLTDHLGSVIGVMDDTGALLEEARYLPFGSIREEPGIQGTDLGYTGQRSLAFTGLMDYKARFYDSDLGRFIQPDTIIPGAGNTQSWNRYSYTMNNPINYNDPSGHVTCDEEGYCLMRPGDRLPNRTKLLPEVKPIYGAHPRYIDHQKKEEALTPKTFWNGTSTEAYIGNTPPDTFIGGGHIVGYGFKFNWWMIDKSELTINLTGLVADGAFFASIVLGETAVVPVIGVPLGTVAEVLEVIGISNSVYKSLKDGDATDLSVDHFKYALEKSGARRLTPFVGALWSLVGLIEQTGPALEFPPIIEPDS